MFVNCSQFDIQQCVAMFYKRSTLNSQFDEVCGAMAALVFLKIPLVLDTERNRIKYERYI